MIVYGKCLRNEFSGTKRTNVVQVYTTFVG